MKELMTFCTQKPRKTSALNLDGGLESDAKRCDSSGYSEYLIVCNYG
jgi:hypothetical protein